MRVLAIVNHGDEMPNVQHMNYVIRMLEEAQATGRDVILALPPNHTIEIMDYVGMRLCAYCMGAKYEGICPGCGAAVDYEFLIEVPTKVLAEWHEEP